MIFRVFLSFGGIWFLVSCRVVPWTWIIKKHNIFLSITIHGALWPWISGLERKPSPDVKGSYIIGWTTNSVWYFTFHHLKCCVSRNACKILDVNQLSSLESFWNAPSQLHLPFKERKTTHFEKKTGVYPPPPFPVLGHILPFWKKKKNNLASFFWSKFSPPTGGCFFGCRWRSAFCKSKLHLVVVFHPQLMINKNRSKKPARTLVFAEASQTHWLPVFCCQWNLGWLF